MCIGCFFFCSVVKTSSAIIPSWSFDPMATSWPPWEWLWAADPIGLAHWGKLTKLPALPPRTSTPGTWCPRARPRPWRRRRRAAACGARSAASPWCWARTRCRCPCLWPLGAGSARFLIEFWFFFQFTPPSNLNLIFFPSYSNKKVLIYFYFLPIFDTPPAYVPSK